MGFLFCAVVAVMALVYIVAAVAADLDYHCTPAPTAAPTVTRVKVTPAPTVARVCPLPTVPTVQYVVPTAAPVPAPTPPAGPLTAADAWLLADLPPVWGAWVPNERLDRLRVYMECLGWRVVYHRSRRGAVVGVTALDPDGRPLYGDRLRGASWEWRSAHEHMRLAFHRQLELA